ncbi:hypothetical protein [Pandoraea bronchicola]|uniref:Uncharacterized protein n=1 Tax=Pandoraea bronchicola TaxID=2508287 RepID=A0A5E5C1T9_9BURK|nr:hypothetical protein [Pandoraea bronchicola]VVE90503.1 hypothetical protein PBR20603_04488 [Pandoraea bronchicola]
MTITATSSSPVSSDRKLGWSQCFEFSVEFSSDAEAFQANDYVHFYLDDPATEANVGIRAIDPKITANHNAVKVDLGNQGKTAGAKVDVYITELDAGSVTFQADLCRLVNGEATVLASLDDPVTRPVAASFIPAADYLGAGTKIVATGAPTQKPDDQLQNYFKISYKPVHHDGTPFMNDAGTAPAEFVGALCLRNADGEVITGEAGIKGLNIYKDKAGTQTVTADSDLVTLYTTGGKFEVYVSGADTPVNGLLHLDIEGNTTDATGQIIVTDLNGANPRLHAPVLTGPASMNVVDAAIVSTVQGAIFNNSGNFSHNSDIYIISWNDDGKQPAINFIGKKTWINAFQWSGISSFQAATSSFTLPEKTSSSQSGGVLNRIGYIYITAAGVAQMSASTMLRIWKSAPVVPPVTPPLSSSDLPKPLLPEADKAFPNRVTPAMCKAGLKVQVGWDGTKEQASMTVGTSVSASISMTGWDWTTGDAKHGTGQTTSIEISADDVQKKSATLQFNPFVTAGYRDDPATGDLGTIMVTWCIGAPETFDNDPTMVSPTITDEFYSHEVA